MLHMVPMTPRYEFGVGTIVSISVGAEVLTTDGVVGLLTARPRVRKMGDVNVAICARRRTVSSGNRRPNSRPDEMKVKRLQVDGLTTGSRERYDFRKRGVLMLIRFGRVEDKTVIGRRWGGVR